MIADVQRIENAARLALGDISEATPRRPVFPSSASLAAMSILAVVVLVAIALAVLS